MSSASSWASAASCKALADAGDAGDGVAAAGRERPLLAGVGVPVGGRRRCPGGRAEVTEEAREVRDRVVVGLVAARGVGAEARLAASPSPRPTDRTR